MEELRSRLGPSLGDQLDNIIDTYKRSDPDASPFDLLMAIGSGVEHRRVRVTAAEKAKAATAPVYAYMFQWESPIAGGLLKSAHTMEIPFVFDNVDSTPITGNGQDRYSLAATLASTWIAFARHGDPSHEGLPRWPPFSAGQPATMIFDAGKSRVEADVFSEEMRAWDPVIERLLD
jgi:para-nitrobenzyl esterase